MISMCHNKLLLFFFYKMAQLANKNILRHSVMVGRTYVRRSRARDVRRAQERAAAREGVQDQDSTRG
jgi:hypothetical protein